MPFSWEEIVKPSRRRRDVPALTNVCVIIRRGRREEEDPAWSTYVSDNEPRVLAAVSSRWWDYFAVLLHASMRTNAVIPHSLDLSGEGVSGA